MFRDPRDSEQTRTCVSESGHARRFAQHLLTQSIAADRNSRLVFRVWLIGERLVSFSQVETGGKRSGLIHFCQKMIRNSLERRVPLWLRGRWRVFMVPVFCWSSEIDWSSQDKAITDPGDNPLVPP